MRSPCKKCPKRNHCVEICDKLAKYLPAMDAGYNKREILVDPARIEKYGNKIKAMGRNPDKLTQRWLKGRVYA